MPRRVTLRDLAKVTGLHFSTIGLALHKDPRVAKATVEKVLAAAKKLGHRHDPMLSALSSYRHGAGSVFRGTIGMLVSDPKYHNPAEANSASRLICDAVKARADELGFKVDFINISEPGMTAKRVAGVLTARGIEGLLLAPLPYAGDYMNLPWANFYTVALGYSITSPMFHRACFHQARSTWLHLKELRALGYQRIGLVLSFDVDLRTDHNFLGAYLAEQHYHGNNNFVRPLVSHAYNQNEFAAWLKREKPDCVMAGSGEVIDQLAGLGYSIPRDIGFSTYSWSKLYPDVSGIEERWDGLGTTALELLVELMKNGEHGLPSFPRISVVEGKWRPGLTARKQSGAPKAGNYSRNDFSR
jgi:DNA-binding LacI/PurR family transcriptional regulator